MAQLHQGWRIRKLCRSYRCVIDRCGEREQVVVQRTGAEIDLLSGEILMNACENVSLCWRCLEAQRYQNDRREAESKDVDNETAEPCRFHSPPASPLRASIDPDRA